MKNFFLSLLAILFSLSTFSQTVWDTLPWKSYADYKLQQLNKSYITSVSILNKAFGCDKNYFIQTPIYNSVL